MEPTRKTLNTITTDWFAAVLFDEGAGWLLHRAVYRKGVAKEFDPLFNWINRCYESTGETPSYSTTTDRWPKFEWPRQPLPVEFATLELGEAYRRWELVSYAVELDRLLRDGTPNEAWEHAKSFTSQAVKGSTARGIELNDPMLYIDTVNDGIEVPSMGAAMSGRKIHRSDFILIAARTNVGKSWLLLMMAMDAIKQGWDVVFYSLEMAASDQAKRVKALLGGKDPIAWIKKQPGHLYVVDQRESGHGYTPSDLVKRVDQGSRTMIVVDYGELLRPDTGGRSTEGWNKSAEVSQALQNVAKYVEVPVVAAVQDNRQAVGVTRPGVETLSGSDYWGRDADLVLRLRDESGEPPGSGPTRVLDVVKSRHSGNREPSYFDFRLEHGGIRLIDRMEYAVLNSKEG
jgi:hypothetical protein